MTMPLQASISLAPPVTSAIALAWLATLLYVGATICHAIHLLFNKPAAKRWGPRLAGAALFPHGAAIIIRWLAAGHGPYMAKHEVLLSMSWIAVAIFYLWQRREERAGQALAVVVLPLAFLMLAVGLFADPAIRRQPPSLRSIWLVIHVLFNKIAASSLLIAVGAAALYLIKDKKPQWRIAHRLPALPDLDRITRQWVGFGFLFWTITIAAGAIWANEAWGRYWDWDPIETWSLITWLCFGLYLHGRRFFAWRGQKAAWLVIVCFTVSILTLFLVPFLPGSLHSEYFQ